uniref:Uncharacterized protein n=1 Tax=Oryza punctata TaxID=4537 RepID=A0A0E0L4E9_ORYPU
MAPPRVVARLPWPRHRRSPSSMTMSSLLPDRTRLWTTNVLEIRHLNAQANVSASFSCPSSASPVKSPFERRSQLPPLLPSPVIPTLVVPITNLIVATCRLASRRSETVRRPCIDTTTAAADPGPIPSGGASSDTTPATADPDPYQVDKATSSKYKVSLASQQFVVHQQGRSRQK